MAYNFTIRAASAELALAAAETYLDEQVLPGQPDHAAEKPCALANLENMLSMLRAPGVGEEIVISLQCQLPGTPVEGKFAAAGNGCTVWIEQVS